MTKLQRYLALVILLTILGCQGIENWVVPAPAQVTVAPVLSASSTVLPPTPTLTLTPTLTPPPTLTPTATLVPTATLAPLGEVQSIPRGYFYLGSPVRVALGFNMEAGGALGRLRYHRKEFLDSADFGRYIQFSPYDGQDKYVCSSSGCFKNWGWNPLQAGSSDGIPAKVLEFRSWEDGLYIKSVGQEWAAHRPGSDVIYETWAWDRDRYFEIHTRMTHIGPDVHAAARAEAPAAYFSAALSSEYGYTGMAPFSAEPIEQYQRFTDKMVNNTNRPIFPSEGWMAFGDPKGIGVILALPPQPKMTDAWSMVFVTGDSPQPLGYMAPMAFLETTPFSSYDLTYYLIPGLISNGRALVYDLIPHTNWTFDLGTSEGWQDLDQTIRADNNSIFVNMSASNPMRSRADLNFYGVQHPDVWMELQVQVPVDACLSFITLEDPTWDGAKTSCQPLSADGLRTYRFDFSSNEKWMNGMVTQLQLISTAPAGIEITGMGAARRAYGWEFGNPMDSDGWHAVNQLETLVVQEGRVTSHSLGEDPYMLSPLFNTSAIYSRIEIRMSTSLPSNAKFYFITSQDRKWDNAKSMRFKLIPDGEFHVYTVDMISLPGWQGQIMQLRLDPLRVPGEFAIDYIRLAAP